jgi:hypothetical protein
MEDGKPVHPAGLGSTTTLKASRGHKARVDTSPLCIIELSLTTLPEAGTPARVLDTMMQGCYTYTPWDLTTEYIKFGIGSKKQWDEHSHEMASLVKRIST